MTILPKRQFSEKTIPEKTYFGTCLRVGWSGVVWAEWGGKGASEGKKGRAETKKKNVFFYFKEILVRIGFKPVGKNRLFWRNSTKTETGLF